VLAYFFLKKPIPFYNLPMRISIKGDAGVQFQVMRMWLEIGRAGCKTNYRKAKNDGSAKYGMVK
jgi:hypothetical protein